MHHDKFGDSYDIVKRSLLEWLSPCGTWAAHPMFSEDCPPAFVKEYAAFLGLPMVTAAPVPASAGRNAYFLRLIAWNATDHLFLDPDTGLALSGSGNSRRHVTVEELLAIAEGRAGKLTLVFDQSLTRGSEEERRAQALAKLIWLDEHGVSGLTYSSHANFILVSTDKQVLNEAKHTLLRASLLPIRRFICT